MHPSMMTNKSIQSAVVISLLILQNTASAVSGGDATVMNFITTPAKTKISPRVLRKGGRTTPAYINYHGSTLSTRSSCQEQQQQQLRPHRHRPPRDQQDFQNGRKTCGYNLFHAVDGSATNHYNDNEDQQEENDEADETPDDTIRVRIWRALAKHGELSLKELGSLVGERHLGDLQSHLAHVSKQAKTFGNKSNEWKIRRHVYFEESSTDEKNDTASAKKLRKTVKILKRRGPKGQIFIRME
mmetsp:Transcript_1179/g.2132  ORF Transcript_1179/g.2132 Transcript_1179/m.2132 type:complete len:242 (-) Transcript_1179:1584-2309(-)